jgi:hypothetical protein
MHYRTARWTVIQQKWNQQTREGRKKLEMVFTSRSNCRITNQGLLLFGETSCPMVLLHSEVVWLASGAAKMKAPSGVYTVCPKTANRFRLAPETGFHTACHPLDW